MSGLFLALLAGLLSTLSPCVLPLLPIVLGTAIAQHRAGPVALAAGLALSFVAIGLFIATIGFSIGLDAKVFRTLAALVMAAIGVVLMSSTLQMRFATAGGPISDWTEQRFGGLRSDGLGGQFAVGLLLGAVWSPCVGPTLGAASVLAAQGENLGQVALTMLFFGVGAGIPLIILGFLSRETLMRSRDSLLSAGKSLKTALGALLVVIAVMILSGFDKTVEAALVEHSPAWLTDLTTRF
ncbi:MAG: cytochrome c biogenesis CcdA family protein [Beijerinckiaceae bacterium]|nr:cytochrome c biogenesis CcdA family protein [Beijerinckiaceae bacterium]